MIIAPILKDGELVEADQAWINQRAIDDTAAPSLDDRKAALKARLDALAERERLKYITPGAGQAMTYQAKAEEAKRLAEDLLPNPVAYPMLAAEVGVTAATLEAVGAIVLAASQQWGLIGAEIEAARLTAKRAIDQAETIEDARAVNPAWPTP